jgi:hypothetical protein
MMFLKDLYELLKLPRVTINLMFEKTEPNEPFYADVVKRFYEEATAPHAKWPFAKQYQYGVSLCELPDSFDDYFQQLDSSARGNYRKALRMGYQFRRFRYNDHLDDIRVIWTSCSVRQGKLPDNILQGRVEPIQNPISQTLYHDYPYFGIFKRDQLVAYAACLIAGEYCCFHDLFGHATYLDSGVVPMLIIEIARTILSQYPIVRYYGYGTYFGATPSLRRFKRKFGFKPYQVNWILYSKPKTLRRPVSAHAA